MIRTKTKRAAKVVAEPLRLELYTPPVVRRIASPAEVVLLLEPLLERLKS